MDFYCDFYKILLDFHRTSSNKNLFECFDILYEKSSTVRLIVRKNILTLTDMTRSINLLVMDWMHLVFNDKGGVLSIKDIERNIKEYKEDPTLCILARGKNIFPRFLDDYTDDQKQKMYVNLIIFLEQIQNS